jgi:hypothetical protein
VIRLYIILLLTFSTGCGVLTNFVVSASGTAASNYAERNINNPQGEEKPCEGGK